MDRSTGRQGGRRLLRIDGSPRLADIRLERLRLPAERRIWSIDNLVSNTPNRIGAVCTEGAGCVNNTNRELLDLFEVAEDPLTDKAAIIYAGSQISIYTTPDGVVHALPEVVLAFEQ